MDAATKLPQSLEQFLTDPTVLQILLAVGGLLAIYGLRWLAGRMVTRRVTDTTARYHSRKLLTFASWVLAILFLASVFSDSLTNLTVAFGVAGAGVAFALQEVIVSVAGWLALTFGGYFKIGDRVMLGGIKGDVIDIGVLRTTIFEIGDWVHGDLYNGRIVRLANSFVFKEPVFNYSADFPFLWDELTVPVRHGSDRARARRILEEVAEQQTGEYARTVETTWSRLTRHYLVEKARLQPIVTMVMDANWMTYTVRYVVDYKRRRTLKNDLFEQILDRFEATDGAVSVASAAQEITLMKPSTVAVDLPERAA